MAGQEPKYPTGGVADDAIISATPFILQLPNKLAGPPFSVSAHGGRGGAVMADDARARKLQPIYNALDARNYKAAIKLCGKKDLEKWDVVKTLKAHALERLGRVEEALDLCREVKARKPTDDVVLSTMVMTLKATGQTTEATECYEAALSQLPDNEDHARELFFCYCRQRAYAKAQQLATRLYKQLAQPEYLFWAATCMKLQAPALGPPMGPKMIELAERMAEKALVQRCGAPEATTGTTAPSAEELELYLGLVEDQDGQTERALATLRRWTARTADAEAVAKTIVDERSVARQNILPMPPHEREAREGALLLRLGRWEEARALFRRRLAVNPDQWADWVGLLDATLQQEPAATGPEVHAVRELALELQASRPLYRGPYLAEMELLLRVARVRRGPQDEEGLDLDKAAPAATAPAAAAEEEALGDALARLLLAYLGRFGTKLCCFDDLLPYTTALSSGDSVRVVAPLVQQLERLAAENSVAGRTDEGLQAEEERPAVVRSLQLFVRAHQLLRLLRTGPAAAAAAAEANGDSDDAQQRRRRRRREEEVAALSAEYSRTLFVNEGAEGGQREVQQGDELVLLVAHLLEEAALDDDAGGTAAAAGASKAALLARLEAAVLLEQGLRYSPYNYHFRLALLATYDRLGAGEPSIEQFNGLDVKQVQLDTLSWLLYPGCLRHGFYTEARVRSRQLLAMHAASAREAHDHVARALGRGTYAKALEIERFQRARMGRSLQLALARCEAARMELLQRHHGLDAALTYLRELASGMLPESLAGEREEELRLLSSSPAPDAGPASGLSDNMDYLVVRDWRYCSPAQEEKARRARGQRHVLRVRLWLVLQRALLAGLLGEASQLRDRLPQTEELLRALGYLREEHGVGGGRNGTRSKMAAGARAAHGWAVLLRGLQALAPVLDAVAAPTESALVDAAVQGLEDATVCVAAAEEALLGKEERAARTLDRALGAKCGLLDPDWLRNVSGFVAVAGPCAQPVLLKIGVAVLPLTEGGGGKRKGKAKKGKAAADGACEGGMGTPAGGVPDRLVAAARGLLRGMERLLAGLEASLKAFDRARDDAEPAASLAARELGERLWSFVKEADFTDGQAHVVEKVRSSHQLSAERLREVLRAKGDALRAVLSEST